MYDILKFGFKITEKNIFVKIEVYGKDVGFLNIEENTKENLINLSFLFSFLGILSLSPHILQWEGECTKVKNILPKMFKKN